MKKKIKEDIYQPKSLDSKDSRMLASIATSTI
jgi:hypothetical protein